MVCHTRFSVHSLIQDLVLTDLHETVHDFNIHNWYKGVFVYDGSTVWVTLPKDVGFAVTPPLGDTKLFTTVAVYNIYHPPEYTFYNLLVAF